MHTLLLADDSITVQRVIALTFAEEPIRVVAVSDGQQAIETLATERPDIILAATVLSQISGYELARLIRSKPDAQRVPVLLLRGAFEAVDEVQLTASGADGVIEKPVEPLAVIARVRALLGLKADAKPAVTLSEAASPKTNESRSKKHEDLSGLDANASAPAVATPAIPPERERDIADAFAALLAIEQGAPIEPSTPVSAKPPAPHFSEDMLDQIASRVAERLAAGRFSEQLRHSITDSVRDTVRVVVSQTSERLVRDEIDRIKARTQT